MVGLRGRRRIGRRRVLADIDGDLGLDSQAIAYVSIASIWRYRYAQPTPIIVNAKA